MGQNSHDALNAYFEQFLSQYLAKCTVVGENIITPDRYDATAGGHKLPRYSELPCGFCGSEEHASGVCPNLARDGTPDWKRGQ